jgi:hypothetical protein
MQTNHLEGLEIITEYVNVYLRTYEKKAILVSIPRTLSYSQIKDIIGEKISIRHEKMNLFHRGQRINDQKSITFG